MENRANNVPLKAEHIPFEVYQLIHWRKHKHVDIVGALANLRKIEFTVYQVVLSV